MGSTYTDSGGIEKIGLGEQAGAWGTTTNNNFDIIDRLINGVGTIALSGTSHTLTTSDGSLSDGMFKVLVLGGSPSGTNTITIQPPNADKLYFVKNGTNQNAIFTQGSGGNVTVTSGKGAIIFADGAGSGAKVTDLTALFTISQAIDGINIGTSTPGTGAFSALTVDNVVIDGATIGHTDDTDLITVASGIVTVAGELSATTLDINGTNITSTAAELNILDGVTATASELNIMDGVTATTAELNIMDGVTATTAELNIMDGVTATTAELNIMDGVTASTAELNIMDGVTATASELNIMDGVTATTSEINVLDGYTGSVTELNYLDTLHATGVTSSEFDFLDGVTSNIQTQLNTKVTSSGVTQVTGGTGLNGTVTSTGSLTRTAAQINSARDGTVTSVSGGTGLSGTVTSSGSISLNTGIGDVGTYAFLARSGATTITAGQTYTNSSSGADNNNAGLMYSGMLMADSNFSDNTALDATGSSVTTGLTGVWRAMGEANHTSRRAATLFLRIS
jgi:hypothetical protein